MISNTSYVTIQGWMINELNLSGNELMVYALIYGFSQDGKSDFHGGLSYIQAWINCGSPTTVKNTLKSLVQKGHIEKKTEYSPGTRHVAGCRYFATICHQISPTMQKGDRPQLSFDDYRADIKRRTANMKSIDADIPDADGSAMPDFIPDGADAAGGNIPDKNIVYAGDKNGNGTKSDPTIQNDRGTNSDPWKGQILTHGGTNSDPWKGQILTHGGTNSDPNNKDILKDTAAIAISAREAADRVFGQNFFGDSFSSAAAAFFPQNNIQDFESFFRFCEAKASAKKPNNMRSYVYSLIFQPDVCAEYTAQRLTSQSAEKERVEKMHTCPACNARFGRSFSYCQTCGLSVADWNDESAVARARKFRSLPADRRKQYEERYGAFREKLIKEHGVTYFCLPDVAETERAFMRELNAEFGVA